MMATWYYMDGKQQFGPVPDEELDRLIREGRVGQHTLVCKQGAKAWTVVATHREFREAISKGPPGVQSPAKADRRTSAISPSEPDSLLAHAWPRFWARVIDIGIVTPILGFLIALVAAFRWPWLYHHIIALDDRVFGILLLPVVSVVLAILMTAFGATPGKFVLSVRVRNLSKRKALQFHLARELKVWVQGLALGIPIVCFFAQYHQYRLVASGSPAGYDKAVATVVGRASPRRLLVAAAICVGLFLGLYQVHAVDRVATTGFFLKRIL